MEYQLRGFMDTITVDEMLVFDSSVICICMFAVFKFVKTNVVVVLCEIIF